VQENSFAGKKPTTFALEEDVQIVVQQNKTKAEKDREPNQPSLFYSKQGR
jgi:hypothetical protein